MSALILPTVETIPPPPRRLDLLRAQQLVSPDWLADFLAGRAVHAAPARTWRLLEVGCGARDAYLVEHVPAAGYLDTAELESGPFWNKVADAALLRVLLANGIRHDTSVILYGRNMLAAARAAHLMLYAGLRDVRLIDGGFGGLRDVGLVQPAAPTRAFQVAREFGAVFPGRPDYLIDSATVRTRLQTDHGVLVSIRTWDEYSGRTSGYPYIAKRGDIPGARWGRAGAGCDIDSMSAYQGADGRMRPAAEIAAFWHAAGIVSHRPTAFFCGTGWRASLAFFYAWLMGWDDITLYDGGWCEWSHDPANAVVCRVRKSAPDTAAD